MIKLSGDESLLGKSNEEFAEILRWASLGNSEILPNITAAFGPLIGRAPFNKKQVDTSCEYIKKVTATIESHLLNYTYLVGDRVTLADLLLCASYFRGFQYLFGTEWMNEFPNVTKWYKTMIKNEFLEPFFGKFEFREKPVEFVPPKKDKKAAEKPKAEKKEEAPKEDKPAPKPKHPLEALGKPKLPIDDWKRCYSNDDTVKKALPYFWNEFYNSEEWSLWKVTYKYNDELTLTFMSNNLIGGFFARLLASTKYLFGSMVVYGENNNNGITGYFLVRGQDHAAAFDVAPDWESYDYEKLNGDDEETRKFIENMLLWEEPVIVNGEKREIADGKIFK